MNFLPSLFKSKKEVSIQDAHFKIIEFNDGMFIIEYLKGNDWAGHNYVWNDRVDFNYKNAQRFRTKEDAIEKIKYIVARNSVKGITLV